MDIMNLNDGDKFEQDQDTLHEALELMLRYWAPVEVAAEVMAYLAERALKKENENT